jgi:hypothetical protein
MAENSANEDSQRGASMKNKVASVFLAIMLVASIVGFSACVTPAEEALEVVFRQLEAESEASALVAIQKGEEVLLDVTACSTGEPVKDVDIMVGWEPEELRSLRFTSFIAVWTPELGDYFWYSFADWLEESPQYEFGFIAAPFIAEPCGNYNTARSNCHRKVLVSANGEDIAWYDKGDYLGLMKKLTEALDEIGSRSDIINLLEEEVPISDEWVDLCTQQELLLREVSATDYDEALAQLAMELPYQLSEPDDPKTIMLEAGALVLGTAADLTSSNPLIGASALAAMQPISESISEEELMEAQQSGGLYIPHQQAFSLKAKRSLTP